MKTTDDHIAQIVAAYVSNNPLPVADLPTLIASVRASFDQVEIPARIGAVSIEDSIGEDFIICMEDGKRMKMMKRYLHVNFNMTPEEYRERWNLPEDYPMVCWGYSKQRQEIALDSGLGKAANPE
jgi:predicted transcriptional regulator